MLVFVCRIVKLSPFPSGSILRYPALNFNRTYSGGEFHFCLVYPPEDVYIKAEVLRGGALCFQKEVGLRSYCFSEAVSLKGVQYAAKKYVTYTVNGVKREQGWMYGFTEPYQIFILYMMFDKEGAKDRQDMRSILNSFELVMSKK